MNFEEQRKLRRDPLLLSAKQMAGPFGRTEPLAKENYAEKQREALNRLKGLNNG
jgi:hypothetical protein